MVVWLVAGVVVLAVVSIALSEYAHRRAQGGDPRFAHLVFAPRLLVYGVMLAAGVGISLDQPAIGIPFALGALILIGAWVRAGRRVARSTRAGKTPEEMMVEVGDAVVEPLALYGILILVGGMLAVIGLVVVVVVDRP